MRSGFAGLSLASVMIGRRLEMARSAKTDRRSQGSIAGSLDDHFDDGS
jgi:hypothetical protein